LVALFPTIEQYFPGLRSGSLQYLATGIGVILLSRHPGGVIRMLGDWLAPARRRTAARDTDATAAVRPRPRPRPRSADDLRPATAPPALELRGIRAAYGGIE